MEILHCDAPEAFDALVMEPRGQLVLVEFWGHDCPNCELFEAVEPELLRELGDGKVLGRMTSFKGKAYWLGVIRDHLAVPAPH